MRYLLDTNVLKEVGKPEAHQNVKRWLKSVDDNELAISAMSIMEIYKGIEKLRTQRPDVADILKAGAQGLVAAFSGRLIAIDEDVALVWGTYLGRSDKHVFDKGLAASALVHKLVVVTRNIADFQGLGIVVLDPFKASPVIHTV
ncbi:type II toxin-antitoxin system VapC family toxin [Mesorhizobium sp. B2-4-13]|uniref:type II toxin-antitoxin system VapC family toxin n=1 Tax=Mesorhizobium sp. B2-4-13 TaxID=2589936 RepID=UPI00114EA8A4|nr:type II toxin-antitoxin system VapC family toxin [Mesorhizobium sp. B2-4-13]TPK85684.1 type II toxin-antitoxin system VapC family toxin [Mesorhizobium sp. B2-4-13]